jgi:hypothetical protein
MVEKNQAQVKEIPVGVKIISVLYHILAALCIISLIWGSFFILGAIEINYTLVIPLAVLLLGFAILSFFVGRGLWKGNNWSRIVAIVIAILNIIVTIVMLAVVSYLSRSMTNLSYPNNIQNILEIFDIRKFIPKAIVNIVINGLIAGYLLFSRKVKETFK